MKLHPPLLSLVAVTLALLALGACERKIASVDVVLPLTTTSASAAAVAPERTPRIWRTKRARKGWPLRPCPAAGR